MSEGLAQSTGPQVVVRPELAIGPFFVGAYAKNVDSPVEAVEEGRPSASTGLWRILPAGRRYREEAVRLGRGSRRGSAGDFGIGVPPRRKAEPALRRHL